MTNPSPDESAPPPATVPQAAAVDRVCPTDTHAAPFADLWARARAVWEDIVLEFGDPAGLAEHGWMIRHRHARLQGWLRALSALVQRLILMIALSLHPPSPKPSRRRPLRLRHGRIVVRTWFPRWPETWSVLLPLPLAPSPRCPRARNCSAETPCRAVLPLWGSAQRLEALRRLIEDPRPRARRLARLLARRRGDLKTRQPVALDRWRPPAAENAAPHLVVSVFADLQQAAEAAFARWRVEPG